MRNSYRVQKRQWRKWNDNARNVFNTLFGTMVRDQLTYNAMPNAEVIGTRAWRVIAWNAAFIAACSVAE